MCEYSEVNFACSHTRHVVLGWCSRYTSTHVRCPPVVALVEYHVEELCGDCKARTGPRYGIDRPPMVRSKGVKEEIREVKTEPVKKELR